MATALTRWDPAAEIAAMRNWMDRVFQESFGRFPAFRNGSEDLGPISLALDVIEQPDSYVIKAAVPGVDPKDVEITVEDDVLTIRGQFEHKEEANEANYLRREIRYGSFERQLRLPPTVDAEKANASFEHGMLRLVLPKKPEARARSIKITPQGVVEGQAVSNS
ncbi:Hsp20/alpha crystallin family protein [Tepidiforma sp.]|uniref:Hsp20/alpha crystallin family protein n=1 Tax=Tepidiforma sp. TaxID=2682230 RepID=UPI002ADD5EFD|nr:Hsp20/alpha crystallin family protein [Tepidiforma sp.]